MSLPIPLISFLLIPLFLLLPSFNLNKFATYSQCDKQWANDTLGTSNKNICQGGSLMTSAAMALRTAEHNYTPKTLNAWLRDNNGYVSGNLLVWTALNRLGLTFKGFIANRDIKANLDAGNLVIVNVRNSGSWAFAIGVDSDGSIKVHDPAYLTTKYVLEEITDGNTGVYLREQVEVDSK